MDDDTREKVCSLMAQHRDLERQLKDNAKQMLDMVWPTLTTKAACRELLEYVRGNGELRHLVECRMDSLRE